MQPSTQGVYEAIYSRRLRQTSAHEGICSRRLLGHDAIYSGRPLEACMQPSEGRARLEQVGSAKSVSGHSLGAAGVHAAIYSLLTLDQGYPARALPVLNLITTTLKKCAAVPRRARMQGS